MRNNSDSTQKKKYRERERRKRKFNNEQARDDGPMISDFVAADFISLCGKCLLSTCASQVKFSY